MTKRVKMFYITCLLHEQILNPKGLILQGPLSKNHTQISFYTQMFISQINFPFKHKEWNLDLHKDGSKMKSLQYIVITVLLVTTGFNCLTSKNKDIFKKSCYWIPSSASDQLYTDLQNFKILHHEIQSI